MVKAKLNLREFNAAIRAYAKESKKDFSDVLNHAGAKVAVRAIRETPKAGKNKFPMRAADDPTKRRKVTKAQRKKGTKQGNYTKAAKSAQNLFFGLAKKRGLKGAAAVAYAHKLWAQRRSGTGEGKAGWIKPALEMGANITARPLGASKTAGRSKAKRATQASLRARLQNMADAAGTPGAGGLNPVQRAINYAAKDMMKYAKRKMQERARKYSGR